MAKLTADTIKTGMRVRSIYNGMNSDYASFLGKTGTIRSCILKSIITCSVVIDWDDGSVYCRTWTGMPSEYFEEFNGKKRKPKKIIPDIPLDPNMPILQAGHIQDRQRKRFR